MEEYTMNNWTVPPSAYSANPMPEFNWNSLVGVINPPITNINNCILRPIEELGFLNEWTDTAPIYTTNPLTEFNGNPLAEAINPPPTNNDEAIQRLIKKPDFKETDLELPQYYRVLCPPRLLNFMFPNKQHINLMNKLYGQILNGYRRPNPRTALGQQFLHNAGNFRNHSQNGQVPQPKPATVSFLTGLSGMGKSTIIRAIMESLGKQVIRHSQYKNEPFTEAQILYMKNNVPDQCSVKNVCKNFGSLADTLIGDEIYLPLFSSKNYNRRDFVAALRTIIVNHHVGVLIIDEFQNISLAKSGGKEELLALILNFREELGVPIILVGTYKAANLLKDDLSLIRRAIEDGFYELKRPTDPGDEDWISLCEVIWNYQWIHKPCPFSEEMVELMYDYSQGITAIMIDLFIAAQIYAIETGTETITPKSLQEVFQTNFRPLHNVIDILRSNDLNQLQQYDDLYLDFRSHMNNDPYKTRLDKIRNDLDKKIEAMNGDFSGNGKKLSKKSKGKKSSRSHNSLKSSLEELQPEPVNIFEQLD